MDGGVPVFIGNLKKLMRAHRYAPGNAGALTRFGSATLPEHEHKPLFCKQFCQSRQKWHTRGWNVGSDVLSGNPETSACLRGRLRDRGCPWAASGRKRSPRLNTKIHSVSSVTNPGKIEHIRASLIFWCLYSVLTNSSLLFIHQL